MYYKVPDVEQEYWLVLGLLKWLCFIEMVLAQQNYIDKVKVNIDFLM